MQKRDKELHGLEKFPCPNLWKYIYNSCFRKIVLHNHRWKSSIEIEDYIRTKINKEINKSKKKLGLSINLSNTWYDCYKKYIYIKLTILHNLLQNIYPFEIYIGWKVINDFIRKKWYLIEEIKQTSFESTRTQKLKIHNNTRKLCSIDSIN